MKRPNITPGPWVISSFPKSNRINVDGDNEKTWVASVHSRDMKEPNAKAISAVPEMMEALEAIWIWGTKKPENPAKMLQQVQQALLKAGYTELYS